MRTHNLLLTALMGSLLLALGPIQENQDSDSDFERPELTREESRWLDRLPKDDRNAAERSRGWGVPGFDKQAKWVNGTGPSLESLRGKVVFIQTFATRGPGRAAATRLKKAIEQIGAESDFVAIAVHTPEYLDRLDALLPNLKLEIPVMIDEEGIWCDKVGAFKRPVGYLVDRQGNIRYAGISTRSLEDAVEKLLAEPFDASEAPRSRPAEPTQSKVGVQFPISSRGVGSATDRRQQRAPDFYVEEIWKQPVSDANGKVVVLDFWATWCKPCRDAIPHMNDLQNKFGEEVVCLGISDESGFDKDMARRNLKANDFAYGLAVDTSGTLKGWFGVRGIPHVVVLSGDWIVRWQGSPTSLSSGTLDAIVKANRVLRLELETANSPDGPPPPRWRDWLDNH